MLSVTSRTTLKRVTSGRSGANSQNLNSIRAFGNAARSHYPQWDTGNIEPTRFGWNCTFPMNDSDFFMPSSSNTLYRNEFHHIQDRQKFAGSDLDAYVAPKKPIVDHVMDLDWSFAGDPHNRIGFHSYQYTHYTWVREPTFPKTPDLSRGELAVGASATRTEVWKTENEPAVVSVSRFTPDNFRCYDYESNAPVPATAAPESQLDFRHNRLPLGHADRRPWLYFSTAISMAITMSMVRGFVMKALYTFWPDKEAFAMGVIEVDLKQIRVGQNLVVKWRGKPVFIQRRTSSQIEMARSDDSLIGSMRDPELDSERAVKADYLIQVGVCTHLGCIPYADQGDYNGFYCPCHGSHYDTSGRIRKGPAPKNLEIPKYVYLDDYTVKIG